MGVDMYFTVYDKDFDKYPWGVTDEYFSNFSAIHKFIKLDLKPFEDADLTDSSLKLLLSKCRSVLYRLKKYSPEEADKYYKKTFETTDKLYDGIHVKRFYNLLIRLKRASEKHIGGRINYWFY